MADDFTLKLGSVDLSPYVRLGPGEGFDPMDSTGFASPQFGTSPLAEGQPLVSTDIQNREMAWPLHLKDETKDAVHALIRKLNVEIATNPALRVEWRDMGASNSTFYDVAYARFDPEYNYWRAAANYESGTLRVWSAPPYGHTGTTRPLASVAASGIVAVLPIPTSSPIIGDAPPLLDVFVRAGGSGLYPQSGRIVGYAPLPHPSYAGRIPAASILGIAGATVQGASGAQDGNALSLTTFNLGQNSARFFTALSPASVYAGGRHRVLAVARSAEWDGMYIRGVDAFGNYMGPTAMATTGDWSIVDLGVFSVPTDVRIATLGLQFAAGLPESWQTATGLTFSGDGTLFRSGGTGFLSELIVVPDDKLHMVIDSPRTLAAAMGGVLVGAASGGAASGYYDRTGVQYTVPSYVAASGFIQAAGYLDSVASGRGMLIAHPPVADMRLTMVGHIVQGVKPRKQFTTTGNPYFQGVVATNALSIYGIVGGVGTVLLASAALGQATSLLAGAARVDFGNQGDSLYLSIRDWFNPGNRLASIGVMVGSAMGGTVFAGVPGQAGVLCNDESLFGGLYVESLPSTALGSRDGYEFTDTGSIQRQTSASVFNGDVTGQGRGAGILPRTGSQVAAVLAFACNLEGGSGIDLLDVGVSVRERFQFAR